ncbi:suppressor of glycerol defect [Microbotryomycetes sp. JL201]|nr:suppressor of glycerol defect [Microbotryomycetes sp. JL201]
MAPPSRKATGQQRFATKGQYVAHKRSTELPASLRQELQELGHLPKSAKDHLGRKDRRKQARQATKQAKADHFGRRQQPHDYNDNATRDSEAVTQSKRSSKASRAHIQDTVAAPASKKRKLDPPPVAQEAQGDTPKPSKQKTTALERMLARQERQQRPASARARSGQEAAEDREIEWLEHALGMRHNGADDKDKWRSEFAEDGLDELFDGLDDLEGAAFGQGSSKNYQKLLKRQRASSDEDDDDDDDEDDGSDDDDDGLNDEQSSMSELDDLEQQLAYGAAPSDDSDEDAFGENGISDDELVDASDDDDHAEVGELGSSATDDERSEAELDLDENETESELEPSIATPTEAPKPALPRNKDAYIPPHLRKAMEAQQAQATAKPTHSQTPEQPPEDPRLRRQIMGHLNKLSSTNIAVILQAIEGVYSSNPRAVVSATLTTLLLEIVAGRDNLGEQLIVNYAALVAALFRVVGIEFPASVVAKAISMLESKLAKRGFASEHDGSTFQGLPSSKECENIVAFIAELYNFQVISCVLIYDLVKLFIERGLDELDVELLLRILKRKSSSGQQLRQDDPSALKQIIDLVKKRQQGVDPSTMNSRTKFMIESLTNLKNNKTKADANGNIDMYSNLKKFLAGLRKRNASSSEALRITLDDLRASSTKGKWWLVGAAWAGDPLNDEGSAALAVKVKDTSSDAKLLKLARAHGMNTDVRKAVFMVLMGSEDYVDACEKLLQLGLSEVQQREIARVLVQCSGNDKVYNPYYSLVAQRLSAKSHSFQITMQYLLWDFFREIGEKSVGGEEMVKNVADDRSSGANAVSSTRIVNVAKLYAWCIAKDSLSLAVLKAGSAIFFGKKIDPVPFSQLKVSSRTFITCLLAHVLLATQTPSPAFVLTTSATRRDRQAVERVFVKIAPHAQLTAGLIYFFESSFASTFDDKKAFKLGEQRAKIVKSCSKVAVDTLTASSGIA